MKNDPLDHGQKVALFRFGVISDLVHLPPGTRGLYEKLSDKAARTYTIPGSKRTVIAQETIRDWLKKYRKNGFDSLLPKQRSDRGKSRKLPDEVTDLLLTEKEQHPELTIPLLIKKIRRNCQVASDTRIPESTVYKLLARNGLMEKKNVTTKDHRRFAYQFAGELMMSDVMHGPAVRIEGNKKRKTYLIAFIDDATRVIPYAAFTHSENTASFMPVLKQALMRRGIPQRLFVDNGSAFRSQHLSLVCAKLGITLIHAKPYHAQAKGKIERWFRTVRLQFLPMLSEQDKSSIDAINRALWAYIETEYHHSIHRTLGESPLDRWAGAGEKVRYVEPGVDLDELFLFETKRKVMKDRTISLNSKLYEVDAVLVNETVTIRYDPSNQGKSVEVCHQGRHVQHAKLVDTYANCFVKRHNSESIVKNENPKTVKQEPQLFESSHPVDFSSITKGMQEEEDV